MLRRQVSGGFICLRCRLERASSINRPVSPLFHRVASGAVSTLVPRRLAQGRARQLYSTANATKSREEDTDRFDDPFCRLQGALDPHAQLRTPESTSIAPETYEEPVSDDNSGDGPRYKSTLVSSIRSVYHSRGETFTAEKEVLPTKMLGKPAEALVMRGHGRPRKKRDKVVVMDTDDLPFESESMRLFRQLEQESAEPKPDDIFRNIDDLRPSEKQLVPTEFSALRNTLDRGFTNAQLTSYLLHVRQDPSLSPHPARLPTDPAWILERQPWIAAVENPDVSLEPLLYGYITDSMTPKQKLVTLVMRECWGISSYEVLGHDGYLSVKLRRQEFTLLLRKWETRKRQELSVSTNDLTCCF